MGIKVYIQYTIYVYKGVLKEKLVLRLPFTGGRKMDKTIDKIVRHADYSEKAIERYLAARVKSWAAYA